MLWFKACFQKRNIFSLWRNIPFDTSVTKKLQQLPDIESVNHHMRHVSKSINSHSNKQIQGECLFPREEDSCRPVFTLPLPVLPSSSLQENSLGLDWRSFQTSVWCHRSALLAPWQPLSTPATAPGSIHLCAAYILPQRCRQLARVMGEFFFLMFGRNI